MIEGGRAPKAEIERELNFTLIARTLIWFGRFGRVVADGLKSMAASLQVIKASSFFFLALTFD
jgi:predicted trehalose synthase